MPIKAPRLCKYSGCTDIVYSTYCNRHAEIKHAEQLQKERERESAFKRGYNSKWRKERLSYLQLHPLCVHCKDNNVIKAATEVDHIIPHRGDTKLFWRRSNWQALCKSCHSKKTQTIDNKK